MNTMGTISRTVSQRRFDVVVPATTHPKYGIVFAGGEAKAAELAIASALAVDGPANGETFAFMRGTLGLSAKTLSGLLDVTPVTMSRWENGKVPVDRAAWITLGTLVLEAAGRATSTADRLRRIAERKRPPRRVEIRM